MFVSRIIKGRGRRDRVGGREDQRDGIRGGKVSGTGRERGGPREEVTRTHSQDNPDPS